MASGVPEHEVWAAADAVLPRGERPTVERVRTELGRGSPPRQRTVLTVMEWAAQHDVACKSGYWTLDDVLTADEVFLVNSVIGLWPVRQLQQKNWAQHPVSRRIAEWLDHAAAD